MSKYFESFLADYEKEPDLIRRVDLVWESGEVYFDSGGTVLKSILEKEIKNCKEAKYLDGEIVLRLLYVQLNLHGKVLSEIVSEIEFIENNVGKIQNPQIGGFAYMFLGISSSYQGDYAKAFNALLLARKCYAGIENNRQFGWVDYNLGVIHSDLKDFENAVLKFNAAFDIFKRFDFNYGIARCQTGLASVLIQKDELDEAEKLYLSALEVFKELQIQSALSRVYNDLGIIYRKRKQFSKAIEFLSLALEVRRSIGHLQGVATSLNDLGETFLDTGNELKAIELLNESVTLCIKLNNQYKLYKAHHLLYLIYKNRNQPELGLFHLEEYGKYKDLVSSSSTNNKIKELEKKVAAENAEKIAELERIKNTELKLAFDIIEEKNKEILDSINYAKRIQYTLLASDEVLKKYLPEHFVLFKPKDIVSGDFYWFSHGENENVFYLAVCDSTGHGVPGAFMSLLNITYLNEAINEKKISKPGKILDYVREKLIKNVSQDGAKDGMDATLLKFQISNLKLEITYAAAHNSPFVVHKGEFIEMPFDKMPVGMDEYKHPFTTHELKVQKGDMIYLGTDGYADQFGGEKFGVKKAGGKKFKKSNLKKLLVEFSNLELSALNLKLQTAFSEWKGDLEQVDDVCIIGIRI